DAFLHQALHGLAQRAPAHLELRGQGRLTQLGTRRQGAVHDGRAQLARDVARCGLPRDRRDLTAPAHHRCPCGVTYTASRNSLPSPGREDAAPTRRKASQTVTWFAVRTVLPTCSSRSSSQATLCRAVSGMSTACASG